MEEQKKTSSIILEKIEERHIEPKPKWEYLLKNYVFWGIGFISLIVGGAATSVIIFTLVNSDWDVYRYLNGSAWKNFILMLPYIWFIFFILFAFVAHYNVKHTKHGYRYGLFPIVFATVLASIILGFGFYYLGLSHAIDNSIGKHFPGQRPFVEKKQQLLVQPEKGILAGTVKSISDDGYFTLKDFKGGEWNISASDLKRLHKMFLKGGSEIVVIGQRDGKDDFNACALKPLRIKGMPDKLKKQRGKIIDEKRRWWVNFKKNNMHGKNINERKLLQLRNTGCEIGRPLN